ncbi:MAG: hypothetical protein AAGI49_02855 [Bacteroidota bacterium]
MKIFYLFIMMLISTSIWSCSCSGPERFVDGINRKTFIFYGQVVANDTLVTKYDYSAWNGKVDSTIHRVTVLEVKKKYHGYGALQLDTVRVINSHGFECYSGIHNDTIGARFILKGYFSSMNSVVYGKQGSSLQVIEKTHGHYFFLPLCDEPLISIIGNKASGFITKKLNYYYRRRERQIKIHGILESLQSNINYKWSKNYKWADKYKEKKNIHSIGQQTMSFSRAERIIQAVILRMG